MTKVFCGLMFLAACAAAQTVEGTVVNSVTNTGIPAVRVFLTPVSGKTDYSATTDALGHFRFADVNTGTYRFSYMSPGYLSSDSMAPSRVVQIIDDGKPVKLEGRMTALPRISGRVVDGAGKGMANALLEIVGRNALPLFNAGLVGTQRHSLYLHSSPLNDVTNFGADILYPVLVRDADALGVYKALGVPPAAVATLRGPRLDIINAINLGRPILVQDGYTGDVITLDADTQLPRGAARQLVAAMAHPLNRARFDESRQCVVEGYGILQPRMAVALPSANPSRYARLCRTEPGIDPYTRTVSDVYQDLFGEGSFIGKGVYDVDAFEFALAGRFPDNRILSHDLLEGCYARSGLVSDSQLYEDDPSSYAVDTRRRHRWIRGDWPSNE